MDHIYSATRSDLVRFWSKISFGEQCWLWQAAILEAGHGTFHAGDKTVLAHRYMFFLWNGPIPDKLEVCHKCDNPSCVKPAHLFLSTNTGNAQDMVRKGQHTKHSKMTLEIAKEIRERYGPLLGTGVKRPKHLITKKQLAEEYGVREHVIECILYRQTFNFD